MGEYSYGVYRILGYLIFLCRLQFLKACGATLKVPNVEEGFEWIGERVRLISSHSDLYVRSLHPLLPKVIPLEACISELFSYY